MIEAVTFDFWNTLMWEAPNGLVDGRLVAWMGILEEAGHDVDRPVLEAAHEVAFRSYQREWCANRQFCVPDATSMMLRELGLDVPAELQAQLIEAFSVAGGATELHLAEGVEICLQRLHNAGVKLGIVCDVGLTPSTVLRAHLERRGLLELFHGWAFSDEVGWYKPRAEIFEHALRSMDAVASRSAVHVGDRRRTDVGGAIGMGMVAVRYTGVYDDQSVTEPEADIVIDSFDRLPELLGM